MNILEKIDNFLNESVKIDKNQFKKAGNGSGDYNYLNKEFDQQRRKNINGLNSYELREKAKREIETLNNLIEQAKKDKKNIYSNDLSGISNINTKIKKYKDEISQIKKELKEKLKKN